MLSLNRSGFAALMFGRKSDQGQIFYSASRHVLYSDKLVRESESFNRQAKRQVRSMLVLVLKLHSLRATALRSLQLCESVPYVAVESQVLLKPLHQYKFTYPSITCCA